MADHEKARTTRLTAVLSLLVVNGVLSMSQTDIASLYYPISTEFHQSVYGLGVLASTFFVG